jgi:glucose/arabinose dehydrogenase/PKD repeat protein
MARRLACVLLALLLLTTLPPAAPTAAAPPSGFTVETVPGLDGVDDPTAFAFLPDGGIFVTTKAGRLLLKPAGSTTRQTVFDRASSICTNSERGLLGVAVDPAFASNRSIYVYYTLNKTGTCDSSAVNRVSRLTLTPQFTTASETVLIDNIPSPNGNHNAGDLHFGKDGFLYIATGDGGRNDTARELHNLDGAILRITRDGGIPADNPYVGAGTARCNSGSTTPGTRCQEIFAWGLRNPYRIAFDPNAAGTRFYINDVGQGTVEDISEGRKGGDFGWNCFEGTRVNRSDGPCAGVSFASTVAPTFEYRREGQFAGCASITGGAFVPAGVWPAAYDGAYLFGDFVCQKIFMLLPNGTAQLFSSGAGAPTHMAFGPDEGGQALYYADFSSDRVYRVRYGGGGGNRAPTARISATPTAGEPPLQVALNGGASSDPDSGDSIVAYLWDFTNDGTTDRETSGATTSFTFTSAGRVTVALRVRDSNGATSSPATVVVNVGNDAPTAQILAPAAGTRFVVGQAITLRGAASDPEDGDLPGASLRWEVRRHHADHWHPYVSDKDGIGAVITFEAPAPEDLDAVGNSYLEVILVAVDSQGRTSAPVTLELRPRIVTINLTTEPPGLTLIIDDGASPREVTTPASIQSWPGWELGLRAPAGQRAGGVAQQLCGWRHGGAAEQQFRTYNSDTTLKAVFEPVSPECSPQVGDENVWVPLTRR